MTALFLLAQGNSGGQIEQIARTFGVDLPHLAAQIISFSIVCAALYRFAYKPVLRMLEQRRQQIAEGLANTENIKAELAKTEAMRQEVMSNAHAAAAKFIDDARTAAAEVQAQETQKAIAAAEQLIAKAREAAAQDNARMVAEVRREIGRLIVHTAAAVTGKILTPEDQRRLAEETAKQLDS